MRPEMEHVRCLKIHEWQETVLLFSAWTFAFEFESRWLPVNALNNARDLQVSWPRFAVKLFKLIIFLDFPVWNWIQISAVGSAAMTQWWSVKSIMTTSMNVSNVYKCERYCLKWMQKMNQQLGIGFFMVALLHGRTVTDMLYTFIICDVQFFAVYDFFRSQVCRSGMSIALFCCLYSLKLRCCGTVCIYL